MSIRSLLFSVAMIAVLTAFPLGAAPEGEAAKPLVVLPSFAPVVEKAEPAVVNIFTTKTVKSRHMRMGRGGANPFEEDFFDRFFFGGPQPSERKENSLGSGSIIDPAGLIITNNHVVEGAEDIRVKLTSGEEIEAEIIGRDPKTDLALIKLKKSGTYPYLSLGNSGELKIGDWVVAIGNPFGLEHTVTAGILSARGRSIGAGPYDDFLQTDASINPGNSGGPLLNLAGEVIGINTAIATRNGGSVGIGFAIPANMAKGVVEQLKDKGRVVRGWMGVVIQKVTPELAKSYGLKEPRGALIGDVDPTGPAVDAKVARGDIVLNFDGKDVNDWQDLPLIVANTQVGKKVKVVVFRDKKEVTLNLTVAELKEDGASSPVADSPANVNRLGLNLREITPELAARQKISEKEGLYVAGIEAGSPAAESGLNAGDVIIEIDSQPVKTLDDYRKAVNSRKKGDILRLLIKRGSNTMFYTVTVGD